MSEPGPARIYGWLLKLYPASFREEYETPMRMQFRDEYRDCASRSDRINLLLCAGADVAKSVPAEILCEVAADAKHGIRVYRRRSVNTVLAVLSLGLSIGASTGVFSVMNAVLFRTLPFVEPERLVELHNASAGALQGRTAFYNERDRSPYLQDAATFSVLEGNLGGQREAMRVRIAETSANFFALLGTIPSVGRAFDHGDDVPGQATIAVISHGLWQQFFAGDPAIAGRTLHLNGIPFVVIGIAPPRFDYPGKVDIWTPSVFDWERVPKRGAFAFRTIGRLKPNVTLAEARQMFEAEVRHKTAGTLKLDDLNHPSLISLRDQLAGRVRQASLTLAGLVLLVLLSACANVAQLLLARLTERRGELALRTALGASRSRIAQQLVTEAVILTVTSAAVGLVVAQWTTRIAASAAPASLATQQYRIFDGPVLAFAGALAIVMGLLFGIVPARFAGRVKAPFLRTTAGTASPRTRRVGAVLLGTQTALALTLLVSSIAMGRTFLQITRADLGFHTNDVVSFSVSLQGTKYRTGRAEWTYYRDALAAVRAIPGVDSAGAVSYLPLADNLYMAGSFKLDSGHEVKTVVMNAVTPGYFRAMGTRMMAGHDFVDDESEPAVIVNAAFAEHTRLRNAIVGRRLTTSWSSRPYAIIGVVSTARIGGPASPGAPQVYWRVQEEPPPALTIVAKTSGESTRFLARCRDAVRAVDPGVPIYDVKTLDQRLRDVLAQPKFYTTATASLAVLALVLSIAGIYGTASHAIAQRVREMGIRIALGAGQRRLRATMLRGTMIPISLGAAAGMAVALASGRSLSHLIVNAGAIGFGICAAAALILAVTAFAACWIGTARVMNIDPAEAVRSE